MLFGLATCNDGETSRKCCLVLLVGMMVKRPVLFGPATCNDGETSMKCCLALLHAMPVKLPGSVVWFCYLR